MLNTIVLDENDATRLAESLTNIVNSLLSQKNHFSIQCLNRLLQDFKNSTEREQVKDFFLLLHLIIILSGNKKHEKFKMIADSFFGANQIQLADNRQQGLFQFVNELGEFWYEYDSIDYAISQYDINTLDKVDNNAWNLAKKELIQTLEKAYNLEKASKSVQENKQNHTAKTHLRRKQLLIILSLLGLGIGLNVIAAASIMLKCHGVASFLTALAGSSAALPTLITALTIAGIGLTFFVAFIAYYYRQKTIAQSNTSDLKHDAYQPLDKPTTKEQASDSLEPSFFQTLFSCFYQRKAATETAAAKANTNLGLPTQS